MFINIYVTMAASFDSLFFLQFAFFPAEKDLFPFLLIEYIVLQLI